MSQIVAGLYELGNKIGSGGGGVVYLGRHIRLNKIVVLKADKRKLTTDEAKLRREVDMLKDLSHTYIPQVYDFVQEDGVVYTVMDFIEGDSLDKVVKQEKKPTQADVIKWACQLLEALEYLHTRPPYGILHADIKPANIMLRSNGDVCLIDYNIALALGEDGAVKVGFSRGYASPEHYGSDYIKGSTSNSEVSVSVAMQNLIAGGVDVPVRDDATEVLSEDVIDEADRPTEALDDDTATEVLSEVISPVESDTVTEVLNEDEITEVLNEDGITEALDDDTSTEVLSETAGSVDNDTSTEVLSESVGDANGSELSSEISISSSKSSSFSGTANGKGILLDARSDIYSLGATLYHLLSGHRPAEKATEVKPLTEDDCSLEVAEIIRKSMDPDANKRYQTAAEMRQAFLDLYKNDKRTVKRRKRMIGTACGLAAMFLIGGFTAFVGQRQLSQVQEALKLSEYSANELAAGNVEEAVKLAMDAIPSGKNIFDGKVTAQAQYALADALGVYDLSDGYHALGTVELSSEPFDLAISPDGTKLAATYAYETAVYDMDTGNKLCALPTEQSALSDAVFASDNVLVYAGEKGITAYDISNDQSMWTGNAATTLSLSADRTKVAAVNRDEDKAYVYDVASGNEVACRELNGRHLKVVTNDTFTDPEDNLFALNEDGTKLAISYSDGGVDILDLNDSAEDIVIYDASDFMHFEGGFYNEYLAFNAWKAGQSTFGIVDSVKAEYVGGIDSKDKILLKVDSLGIHMSDGNVLVDFDPVTLEQKELAYTNTNKIKNFAVESEYVSIMLEDNSVAFYNSGARLTTIKNYGKMFDFMEMSGKYAVYGKIDAKDLVLVKREEHEDTQLLAYDARYAHDEARVSYDGNTVMLFDVNSFRIYDMTGKQITEVALPDPGNEYDQQFRKTPEGSYLEVYWYDGTVRSYSAVDGSVISEDKKEKPNKDLYEEFTTEKYLIKSALHEPVQICDKANGKLITNIEEDAGLTYVTEINGKIILEYIDGNGIRYGIMYDEDWGRMTKLPNLCDAYQDNLVFDYRSGDLRKTKVYSLQELVDAGELYSSTK